MGVAFVFVLYGFYVIGSCWPGSGSMGSCSFVWLINLGLLLCLCGSKRFVYVWFFGLKLKLLGIVCRFCFRCC